MNKLILVLLILLVACGKEAAKKSSEVKQDPNAYFAAQTISVNVYYEPGAEPYTTVANAIIPLSYWTILDRNLTSLFAGRPSHPSVSVPKTLPQMTVLPVKNETTWTVDEVVALNNQHALYSSKSALNIYFLNGRAADGANIIGFHLNGGGTIAIFKEVVRQVGNNETIPFVAEYVEQSTIVHEVGHALGLVNNGVPMVEAHQDKEHGAHCSNPDCVMYYANEGAEGLTKHVKKILESSNPLDVSMFDEQCLKDIKSY